MNKLTPALISSVLMLGSLLAAPGIQAQTAPNWTSVVSTNSFPDTGAKRLMDAAGNMYETGSYNISGNFDGYLAKYTPAGTVAWVRNYASAGDDVVFDLALDAAGDVYIAGSYQHAIQLGGGQTLSAGSYPGSKAFVVRYNPQGIPVWARQSDDAALNPATPYCPPGAATSSLSVDANGTVTVSGWYGSIDGFGFGGLHLPVPTNLGTRMPYFLARLSAATGAASSLTTSFYSDRSTGAGAVYVPFLAHVPGGGLYIVSQYYMAPSFTGGPALPAPSSVDVLVIKYTASGSLDWVRTFGGPDFDNVTRIATNAAGDLFITGTYRQSMTFGTTTLPAGGADNGYLVKYSAQGSPQWSQALASSGPDFLYDVHLDAGGNVYVTGSFSDQARLGATTLVSEGDQDVVVAAFNPQGQLRWTQQAGGPGQDLGTVFNFTSPNSLRLFGTGNYNARFGNITPNLGSYDGFMAELAGPALATSATTPLALSCFPNPATDQLQLPALAAGTVVQLSDALGRVVRETPVSVTAAVSVRGLAPGLYTLRATDASGRQYAGKLAVK